MTDQDLVVSALFSVGELVQHKLFGYRGVIADIDANFQSTEEWYTHVAKSRPPKDKPWYHVLVDGSEQTTYVAERNLQIDSSTAEVNHPMVEHFFSHLEAGRYVTIDKSN